MNHVWLHIIVAIPVVAPKISLNTKTEFPLQVGNLKEYHVVIWHGIDYFVTRKFGMEQQIIVNSSYEYTLPSYSNKYTTLKNLAIIEGKLLSYLSPNYIYSNQMLATFKHLLQKSDNVFLIFIKTSKSMEWSAMFSRGFIFKKVLSTPAIKLVFTLDSDSRTQSYKIECDLYCFKTLNPFGLQLLLKSLIDSFAVKQVHKNLFRKGNNHQIKAVVAYVYSKIYEDSLTKNFLCDHIFESRNYHKFSEASYCWAKQMLATEISKVHNISYVYSTKRYSKRLYPDSFILQDDTDQIKPEWANGAYLQYYSGWFVQYCLHEVGNETGTIAYKAWIAPMKRSAWISLTLCWLSGGLVFTLLSKPRVSCNSAILSGLIKNLLRTAQYFIRSPVYLKRISTLDIVILLTALFLYTRYENEITSLVTIEKTIKPFKMMNDFFEAGFRVSTCDSKYLSNKTNNYYCLQSGENSNDFYLRNKLADWQQARWNFWYLQKRRTSYKQMFGKHVDCFSVEEEIEKKPWFMIIHTVNQHWILQTVQWVHEGGFMNKWNDLAQYATSNQDRKTFLDPVTERTPDVIDIRKLGSVVLLCGLLICVSLILFLVESSNATFVNFTCLLYAKSYGKCHPITTVMFIPESHTEKLCVNPAFNDYMKMAPTIT